MACPLHTRVSAGQGRYASRRPLLGWGERIPRRSCVAAASEGASSSALATTSADLKAENARPEAAAGAIRVKVTPPRPASLPPTPPSLIHSPVYVQKAIIKSVADPPAVLPVSGAAATAGSLRKDPEEGPEGNSLVWALKQVDRSLDELEQNPLPLQREIYELSRSPVGNATSSALSTAAKVTVAATKEAVRAAVPVGQWVVKEGAKAAVSLLSRAMAESAKMQQQQQEGGQKGGQKAKGKGGRK